MIVWIDDQNGYLVGAIMDQISNDPLKANLAGPNTFTGDNAFAGLTTMVNGKLNLPVATPVNATYDTIAITVGTVPADYVANVQARGLFTATANNAEVDQNLVIDDQTYVFKSGASGVYEVELGVDIAASIINLISKINSNPLSKGDIVRTGNNFVVTFKNASYSGATGNTKVFTTTITDATTTAHDLTPNVFGGGVNEVKKSNTLNGIEYVYWNDPAGDDPTVEYPDCIPVNTDATQALTATALAAAIADKDPDMGSAVANGAVVTATWGIRGDITPAIAFADGTNGLVTAAAATMTGGVDGTPGYKGMVYHDATTNETWETSEDNYTETQSGWYNTANSASNIAALLLKQDKALTAQTAPTSCTKASATYTGAANAGFVLYSKLNGTLGNGATGGVTYTIGTAADDTLAISVTGNAITINLANATSSKNTATLVIAAIIAKAEALALVYPVLTGTGAGVVATQAVANLAGGVNGTAGYRGEIKIDTNDVEWKCVYVSAPYYAWEPVDSFPALDTEYRTGKKDESGLTIYKKAINFGALPNATTKALLHLVPMSSIVKSEQRLKVTATGTIVPNNINGNTNINQIAYQVTSISAITIVTGVDLTARELLEFIWYTKQNG